MSTEQTPLLVVTTSSKLQEALINILEPEYSCEFAKSIEQAEKILQAKPINATIVDFTAATSNDAIDELIKIDSSLVHVLVCPRDKREELLATDLSNKAYRVLFAPLSSGQTQLAIQSAVKYGSTKTSEQSHSKSKSGNKLIPILAGLGLAAIAAIFFMTRSSEPEVTVQNTQSQQAEPVVQLTLAQENTIRELNTQANNAIELGNLFPPAENNAANAYFEIFKVNENDKAAKTGLENLAKQALGDLELHLGNGSVEDANLAIANAQDIADQSAEFGTYVEQALVKQKNNFVASAQAALSEKRIADALTSIETAKAVYTDDAEVSAAYDGIFAEKENFDKEEEVNNLVNNTRNAMLENNLLTPANRNARYYINCF